MMQSPGAGSQLMVIERLLGIVPHLTRNRQPAREKAAS